MDELLKSLDIPTLERILKKIYTRIENIPGLVKFGYSNIVASAQAEVDNYSRLIKIISPILNDKKDLVLIKQLINEGEN